jgi:hypothetical protein
MHSATDLAAADRMSKLMQQTAKDQDALSVVLQAIETGDPSSLAAALPGRTRAIKTGIPVRGSGVLPLQLAVAKGHPEMVAMLLDAGAPVEQCDGSGLSALQVRMSPRLVMACSLCLPRVCPLPATG